MHICLLPTETLLDIFANIRGQRGSSRGRATIAALARTCRKFKEPALDTLWEHTIGFEPFISCLPDDVVKRTTKWVSLKRHLFSGEWKIFAQYAHRVRSLIIYDVDLDMISDRVVQALVSMPSLLPKLRELQWWDERESFFPLLRALLVPTVRSMKFGSGLYSYEPWTSSFAKSTLLASLGARCPSAQELVCAYADDSHAICEFVCDWKELSHLRTGILNTQSLRHLALLPSLKSLHFRIHGFDDTQSSTTVTMLRFLSCRSVVLSLGDDIEIEYPQDPLDDSELPLGSLDIPDLMVSFSECFSPTLEYISIDFSLSYGSLNEPYLALGFHAVAPLLLFSRLTTLKLAWFCTSTIDDATLKKMAQSWPQIKEFRFGSITTNSPSLTFMGLVHLIQHCRHLRDISMCFRACSIDTSCEPFSKTIPNKKITSISLGHSPITDPIAVACQLHELLPHLTTVGTYRKSEDFNCDWKRVNKYLAALAEDAKTREKLG
ncbi:hypothetical protein AZE42_07487 [Rhizopogon vesiculosus]|uniref:F-box domain-containing protein n=1 Tax=Rhizopogon vesiculosus TaxID=180088 RepID=A0A1J8RF69_9AGAM|nr:hypothetical protein AZE42_07487 [Rhizopogon vesiculosus]